MTKLQCLQAGYCLIVLQMPLTLSIFGVESPIWSYQFLVPLRSDHHWPNVVVVVDSRMASTRRRRRVPSFTAWCQGYTVSHK